MKRFALFVLFAAFALPLTAAVTTKDINKGKQVPAGSPLKPNEYIWEPDQSPNGPVGIIVDLTNQTLYVYRDGKLIGKSTVSTGIKSHPTSPGSKPSRATRSTLA